MALRRQWCSTLWWPQLPGVRRTIPHWHWRGHAEGSASGTVVLTHDIALCATRWMLRWLLSPATTCVVWRVGTWGAVDVARVVGEPLSAAELAWQGRADEIQRAVPLWRSWVTAWVPD
eukprot:4097566-Amphidinium_carterae.3